MLFLTPENYVSLKKKLNYYVIVNYILKHDNRKKIQLLLFKLYKAIKKKFLL